MRYFYYAYSGHKYGLDRVKRAVALIKSFADEGIEVQLLVNDFRAGLVARELGVSNALTIETFLDIDAVAKRGDVVFADTIETHQEKIEEYVALFEHFVYITEDCSTQSLYNEKLWQINCFAKKSKPQVIIDSGYFKEETKNERLLFFFGDADYNKEILRHASFFEGMGMELLLGAYFFVKYDDEVAPLFEKLHESEEYRDLILSSGTVVTTSLQSALEAKASGAKVIYMKNNNENEAHFELMHECGIVSINYFDKNQLLQAINSKTGEKKLPPQWNIDAKIVIVGINL